MNEITNDIPLPRGEIRRFVRETFGLRGTLGLHRAALGGDLVRAPLNVILAPVFLLNRLAALVARAFNRHRVATCPSLVTLRVDESLYFVNARFLEDLLQDRLAERPEIRNVILMCSAVNEIDYSALEILEVINHRLKEIGVGFHLSEVKGPVMDRLKGAHFLQELNGRVFLSQYDAWVAVSGRPVEPVGRAMAAAC